MCETAQNPFSPSRLRNRVNPSTQLTVGQLEASAYQVEALVGIEKVPYSTAAGT